MKKLIYISIVLLIFCEPCYSLAKNGIEEVKNQKLIIIRTKVKKITRSKTSNVETNHKNHPSISSQKQHTQY